MMEDIIVNWKGKIIEYQGKRLLVAEQVEYEKKEYLYCVNTEKEDEIEVSFLYKSGKDEFAHVVDDETFQNLILLVAAKASANEIKKTSIM